VILSGFSVFSVAVPDLDLHLLRPTVMSMTAPVASTTDLLDRFRAVRAWTETLGAPLEIEDFVAQPMPDASPTKWHFAHVTWFWETFLLKPYLPNYQTQSPAYEVLFNSYYNAVGPQFPRARRGTITRPTVAETYDYRRHIDEAMEQLIGETEDDLTNLIELGLNHEQQHQELITTDLKFLLGCNPLHPIYRVCETTQKNSAPPHWIYCEGGLNEIGFEGEGFSFDNEGPRHRVWLEPFELSSQLVTNAQWLEFIEDGGYERSEFWLSAGWNTVCNEAWRAPLYWQQSERGPQNFTLSGLRAVEPSEPVTHVSYFEADAFARWSGARLPTEFEWEVACRDAPVRGNFAENEVFHPTPQGEFEPFGNVWQWTRSQYSPYPGYRADAGALGEYNGKFMCNQFVLRGGSCATPQSHIRPTYRNFFPPDARWQFSGLRLARDV